MPTLQTAIGWNVQLVLRVPAVEAGTMVKADCVHTLAEQAQRHLSRNDYGWTVVLQDGPVEDGGGIELRQEKVFHRLGRTGKLLAYRSDAINDSRCFLDIEHGGVRQRLGSFDSIEETKAYGDAILGQLPNIGC